MGFSSTTTSTKVSSLGTYRGSDGETYPLPPVEEDEVDDRHSPFVRTVQEYKGDEDKARRWLVHLIEYMRDIVVQLITLDQKAAHNLLDVPGSRSPRCFIWCPDLERSVFFLI
jgi:hypothetical protein